MRFPFFRNRDSVKNGILISIRRTGDGFHPGLFSYYQCGCYSDDLLLNWSTDALILELIKFKDILICRTIK